MVHGAETFLRSRRLHSYSRTTVYYHVYKNPPLVPIRSQINPVCTTTYCLRSILIVSTHLRLGLLSLSFLLAFSPVSYMHSSSPHSYYMPCQSHPP
jgi:hypothetical protein